MLAGFFLAFREGLEAALIIGVLLGAVNKLGKEGFKGSIWLGAGLALIASVITGVTLNLVGAAFEGRAEEIFEGVAMLSAAAILTWVILWMQSQARSHSQKLEADTKSAVMKGSKIGLLSLAFLAVVREGVELAFFLTAASISSDGLQVLSGAGMGVVAAVLVSLALFKSLVNLNIGRFFQVTSIILILFAAGLAAHGVHEFNEAGLIPAIIDPVWDINHILSDNSPVGEILKALFGYNGNPTLTEVLAYGFYFVVLWGLSRVQTVRELQQKPAAA